jgi:hypothetical protein
MEIFLSFPPCLVPKAENMWQQHSISKGTKKRKRDAYLQEHRLDEWLNEKKG